MTSPAAAKERKIALAAVAGAHGVKGEVRLKLFAEGRGQPVAPLDVSASAGATEARAHPRWLAARARSPASPGSPTAPRPKPLRGSLVEVDRASLPPLEEGEYYHADIIGLPCVDLAGAAVGTVVSVENFGAGDLLEIEKPDGRRSLIPFRPGIADLTRASGSPSTRNSSPSARAARLLRQIVADGGCGDPAFAHRMADLVEADDDVARRIEAGTLVRWCASTPMQPSSLSARRAVRRAWCGCRSRARDRRCRTCNGRRRATTTMLSVRLDRRPARRRSLRPASVRLARSSSR